MPGERILSILCDILLLGITLRFIGDFLDFDSHRRLQRVVFSCLWLGESIFAFLLPQIPLLNLLINLLFIFMLTLPYKGSVVKKFLISLMIAIVSAAADMLAYILVSPLLTEEEYYYSYPLTVVFILLAERIFVLSVRKKYSTDIVGKEIIILSGYPLLAAVILYCVTAEMSGGYRLAASLCVAGICFLSLAVYNSLSDNFEDRIRRIYLEREAAAYRHELNMLQVLYRKEQNLRHDLRHHLYDMESLAKEGQNEEICRYIADLRELFLDSKQMVHTGEYETDSLLNFLLEKARSLRIEVSANVEIPEDIDMSRCQFNVILGNLLENAIAAASEAETKRIDLSVQFSKGCMFFHIRNTFPGTIEIINGRVHGRHARKHHGIGLRSVRDLVTERNGCLEISVKENLFVVDGMIPAG